MNEHGAYFKTFRYAFVTVLLKFSALLNFGTEFQNIGIGHEGKEDGM